MNSKTNRRIGWCFSVFLFMNLGTEARGFQVALEPPDQGINQNSKQEDLFNEQLKAGAALFKVGKYDEALARYQDLLKQYPRESAVHFNIGVTYQAKKDLDSAINAYQRAVDLAPDNNDYRKVILSAREMKAGPLIEKAAQKFSQKDYTAAIDFYQQAFAILPKNAALAHNLATALYVRQQYDKSQEYLKASVALDPKGQADDLFTIATIDEHFGRGKDALDSYRDYLSSSPNGVHSERAKERVEALTASTKNVIKIKPTAEIAHISEAVDLFNRALDLHSAKKFDEALPLYQKAVDLQPKNANFLYGLGTLYVFKKEYDKAIPLFEKAAALAPKEAAYPYAIGTAFQAKEDFDKAISFYQKAIALAPENKDFQKVLFQCQDTKSAPLMDSAYKMHTNGKIVEAIKLYQQGLAISPSNAPGWTNLATAYQDNQDFAKARETFQKALDLDPKSQAENRFYIALLEEHLGQGKEALQTYQQYISSASTPGRIAYAKDRVDDLTKDPKATKKLPKSATDKDTQNKE